MIIKIGKIGSLTIVTNQGTKSYYVGSRAYDMNDSKRIIDRIEDRSVEFPDSLYSIYWIIDQNDSLIATVENCPVNVEYEK